MGDIEIAGSRVRLRAIRDEDIAAIEAWYDEAVLAAGSPHPLPLSRGAGEGRSAVLRSSGVLVIERVSEDGPIGLVEYEANKSWVTVSFIALAKALRGWGYGSEAIHLLEEWAVHEAVAQRFRAEVPARNGLGLYFWLRLGYRPASVNEFNWRSNNKPDMMPMVRTSHGA